ncbi:hypothetical protein NC651_016011 [Populus alba x Populus x berolinensis]|nr:hypothetical protein NC651_016011 [Populus alba x Populus x berolinensis]
MDDTRYKLLACSIFSDKAEAELISSIVTCFKQIGISASDVGFKVNSRKVLQEILRSYSLSENLFAKFFSYWTSSFLIVKLHEFS